MHVLFLGTASCYPTPSRGVSCIALQWNSGNVWIFDCGEGSQIQIQKSRLRIGKVTRIFITHLHGDHLFGLPGFLCTLGNGGAAEGKKIEVFGPYGLRKYVRTCLDVSQSPLPYECTFHELVPRDDQFLDLLQGERFRQDLLLEGERAPDCKDTLIWYNEASKGWNLLDTPSCAVTAGAIKHRIPSFAFVVREKDLPGSVNIDKLAALGIKPGPLLGELKRGQNVVLQDGRTIRPQDVLGHVKKGRKVAIFGDTCDDVEMEEMCHRCDLVIHEATMEEALRDKALEYGHSTPAMAAAFAAKVKARRLCLTHLSPRYKPLAASSSTMSVGGKDREEEDEKSAKVLLDEAKRYLARVGRGGKCEVEIAEDFYEIKV